MLRLLPAMLLAVACTWGWTNNVAAAPGSGGPSEHHVYLHVVQPEAGAPVRIIIAESDVLDLTPVPMPVEFLPPVEDPAMDAVLAEVEVSIEPEPESETSVVGEESAEGVPVPESVALEAGEDAAVEEKAVYAVLSPLPPAAVAVDEELLMQEAVQQPADMPLGLLMFIFVLAIFLGFELISKVPSQLHTPLMSGSNAISGITIVGALAAAGIGAGGGFGTLLGTLAVAFATINVVGGYMVTNRMLAMFKKKDGGAR